MVFVQTLAIVQFVRMEAAVRMHSMVTVASALWDIPTATVRQTSMTVKELNV